MKPTSSGYADVNGIRLHHDWSAEIVNLAVVSGYSHYNFIASPEVSQIVGKFLADPLTNPPTGSAHASQATSDHRQS